MKISYRILIINFVIVVLILGSSAVAFYSILYNVLSSQQSKYLLNSANEFIYTYRSFLQDTEDEFRIILKRDADKIFYSSLKDARDIDFIFEVDKTNNHDIIGRTFNNNVFKADKCINIQDFVSLNPYAIIRRYNSPNGRIFYYGRIVSNDFLNSLSKKINADIALIWNGIPAEVSNEQANQKFSYLINHASKILGKKNSFDLYSGNSESTDILATIYKPDQEYNQDNNFQFLIFTSLSEAADLRNNLKYFLVIIGSAGVTLSLILTLLFTDKIRKQIGKLSFATKLTKEGNFQNKIEIISKDELGELALAFNTMLDELQKNEKSKNEYSEFITLLNQNPTLKEISEASLQKIISTCDFTIGALYIVNGGKIILQSSYGLQKKDNEEVNSQLFESVINKRETIELFSDEKLPVVSAGFISIEIKYLLIVPIIYNNKVISILELGSFNKPSVEAKEYLSKIKDQLAIGLTNASAFVQLENLVFELKNLNEDYQKQNIQIRKQNETLVELHKRLKEKAEELEVQKHKAEDATKLKSHFLASMSHELRTPMNSILGLTELILADKNLADKNRERLEVVLKSGRRLMTLINDILDLSKIEAGKMDIHNEEVLVEELIKEVESSIIPLVEKKELSFKIVRNLNTKVIINTDRNKVTQVLLNLLGNAVKFTNNGFVELHISSADNHIYFDVIDSGIGISKTDQKIIFEEFRQIDGTTTRKYSGTGLGLAICKRIAELLNGNLIVKSEPGHGSIFTFSIPYNFVLLKTSEQITGVNDAASTQNRKNPILVIDDDLEVRYVIGQYLISKGYEVEYAGDGTEGLAKARSIQPFAVTLDVMMPNKDGWTILNDLKEDPATRQIPVILISIIGNKNAGYGISAFEYFVKPVSNSKLIHAFNKLENYTKKKIEKIVIVDDDETEFEDYKDIFKNDNIRIDYIKDSEIAFSKILEIQPDLIILDLLMPNVDGISLSYKLKSNVETKHIPIIISTEKNINEHDRNELNKIVEDITVKSKGHPLDALKIVRDRIKILETELIEPGKLAGIDINPDLEIPFPEDVKIYQGNVLIVDDDPDSLFTLSEIVQACDCKTTTARNGLECLRALDYKLPDLILLDIMMPEMDGFQTIARIKQNSKWANIPVFAVTAKAMLDDKKVILKHGFDDYISKPVNSGVLAFKIERIFEKLKTM